TRIVERMGWEVARRLGLPAGAAPALELDDVAARYEEQARAVGRFPRGRFSSPEARAAVLLVEVGDFSTGAATARQLRDRVRADLASLGGPGRAAPGLRVGFAGDVAVSAEELSALTADLTVASLLVVALVALAIALHFRWWPSVPILLMPLAVAAVAAF